jgi:hypothetical protein
VAEELFDIYFSGRLMPDADLEDAKQGVARIFKANDSVIAQLFSGNPVKIKKSVDMDTAIKYRVKFREVGALIDIRPVGSAAPVAVPQANPAAAAAAKPVVSNVPEKPSVTENPVSAPATESIDILDSELAPAGSQIDNKPEPPPANIDTGSLSAAAANTGSLEDFAIHKEAQPLPDISALAFGPDDGPLDDTPEPPPLDVDVSDLLLDETGDNLDDTPPPPPASFDISSLSMSEANSGSLEEFNARPDPLPLPDISKLKFEE